MVACEDQTGSQIAVLALSSLTVLCRHAAPTNIRKPPPPPLPIFLKFQDNFYQSLEEKHARVGKL